MQCPKCHFDNPDSSRFCSKCGSSIRLVSPTETIPLPLKHLRRGDLLSERYEIIEELGRGGMGKVYRAEDRTIKEEIAVKLIRPEISMDESAIERFRNELKIARKISHKNVCRLYHLSDHAGTFFITMEYIAGEDLKRTITRIGQMPTDKIINIAKQVCRGLIEASGSGIVHRDLKPSNIMLDHNGQVKITDFGLARIIESKGVTAPGIMMGTPEYMSPEQVEGKDSDQRSDIYSLGVILYELATGTAPFKGDTPLSLALKHVKDIPINPRTINAVIPEDLSRIILKCLEKDRKKRYSSAQELLKDLEKIEHGIQKKKDRFHKKIKAEKSVSFFKSQKAWIMGISILTLTLTTGYFLLKGILPPQKKFDNFILFELYVKESQRLEKSLIEFLLLRSLYASTNLNIYIEKDYVVYKKQTQTVEADPQWPVLTLTAEAFPKATGFDINIGLKVKNDEFISEKFECKGLFDLVTDKIDKIHTFISEKSQGLINALEGERTFSQICTSSLDALSSYLKGEQAWKKLDSEASYFEYRSAFENDPAFTLSLIRLAEVHLFRGEREEAREDLIQALENPQRLIQMDIYRAKALMARLDFKPIVERQYIERLKESFPFDKEFHYELGESYFNSGNAAEAVKHYKKALELDPQYFLALNHIALCYSWMGLHELAEQHAQLYLELDESANAYDSLASSYMFAGRYENALEALEQALSINPNINYLHTNKARNLILKGSLKSAAESISNQIAISSSETAKINARFYSAYIEFIRGNFEKAEEILNPVLEFYSQETHAHRLDEAASLPFWLTGFIAAKKNDIRTLEDIVSRFEKRISENNVNTTNYFPVFKFYIHLKALDAYLKNDTPEIIKNIDEGFLIRDKMGYWTSMFDRAYFFNQFAECLVSQNRDDDALTLLEDAVAYNPHHALSYVNIARLHKKHKRYEAALQAYQKARELLSQADKDYPASREIKTKESRF